MPRLSPEAQARRNAKFSATIARKKAARAATPEGVVVPLHDLVPKPATRQPRTTASRGQGQPPIVVTFGKVRITIEVGE